MAAESGRTLGPDNGSILVRTYREGVAAKAGHDLVDPDGRITGTVTLTQSAWGIKPYRGLMGALKVRDNVEVEIGVEPVTKG